ncbi:putative N-acetyltransferase YhbS [Runella defluvii]|uniref:Putative N-acetyltransferase YhbS n=1 Tax=Runella defluvii TaxID=370973 RepID=A0A7W6ERX2_9BACT|nr:N-acetyltransferase [Runella defluvii]MBB3840120.1 putative N-acetyltransferase YhbS [Runella defluvii]
MTEQIKIRREKQGDFREVFELNHIAFGQDNEAKLVDALRINQIAFVPELSIVATDNNKIVGHILFSKISIKDDKGNLNESLGLAPMAVRPEYQKCGIGGQLIRKGFEVAKELGFKSVIVLGHEHYYPKFGFQPADKWKIKAPFDVPSNVFMAIELATDGLKNISGTVVYPKEFETV